MEGAKAAVEFVSHCLATGDLLTLDESKTVSPECMQVSLELRKSENSLSLVLSKYFFNFF